MYSYKSQVQVDLAVVAEVRSFHVDGLHSCVECGSKSHQAWPLVGLPVLPCAIHLAKGKRFANLFRRIFKQIYRQLRIGTVRLKLEPLVGCSLRASGNALIDQFRYVVAIERVQSESRYLRRRWLTATFFLSPFCIITVIDFLIAIELPVEVKIGDAIVVSSSNHVGTDSKFPPLSINT